MKLVDKNPSGIALNRCNASAIGGGRAGIIETTFKEECKQSIWWTICFCGGLTHLILAGYGFSRSWLCTWNGLFQIPQVKLIVDLLYEGGMANMRYSISNTAEYGDYSRGPRLLQTKQKEMKKILSEIQSGQFAKEWMDEHKSETEFKLMKEQLTSIEAWEKN